MTFRLFLVGMAIATVLSVSQLWSVRLLYLNAAIRSSVETALRQLEQEEGILLSDMTVATVGEDAVTIRARFHLRGKDPRLCFIVDYQTLTPDPCGK